MLRGAIVQPISKVVLARDKHSFLVAALCCHLRAECRDTHPKVLLPLGTREMITGALVPSGRLDVSVARPAVFLSYITVGHHIPAVKGERLSQSNLFLIGV